MCSPVEDHDLGDVTGKVICKTLVCIWEEFSRKGPPAPQLCLHIVSLLVDGISSNLAHIFSSPGKIF